MARALGPCSGLHSATPVPNIEATHHVIGKKSAFSVPLIAHVNFNSLVGNWILGLSPGKMGLNWFKFKFVKINSFQFFFCNNIKAGVGGKI